jgi:superoxide dismutase, Cu-Zn family
MSLKAVGLSLVMLGVAFAQKPEPITVELKDPAGKVVGTAQVRQQGNGVEFKLNLNGVPAGEHAFHVHQNAVCEADPAKPADAFKSAGPHYNPTKKQHGTQNPQGSHAGDMPNITVKQNGKFKGNVKNSNVSLDPVAQNSLYANGGTALVIHAKADDMKSDPAGNAGDRIACGLVTPKPKPQP